MSNNNYSQVRRLMKLSKENGKIQTLVTGDETILVKYNEACNDFMFQYTWNIAKEDICLSADVKHILGKYKIPGEVDVIQLGMLTVYGKNEDDFLGFINHCREYPLKQLTDTNYIFGYQKVLSIIQYFNMVRNPLEYLYSDLKWSNLSLQSKNKMKSILKGIEYLYPYENGSIVFSVGTTNRNMFTIENFKDEIPQFIFVDKFLQIEEHRLTNK